MTEPLVSIILPTYNGISRGFLAAAVQSVLAQTYRKFELIIVDDGSTDNIAAGCREHLKDGRVRIVHRENGGLSAARMTGVQNATGEFIAFLDDDDRWTPEKLAKQLEFFAQCPDAKAGMVFTGVRLIDAAGHLIGARVKSASGDMYRRLVLEGNLITAPSAVMLRHSVIKEVGNFDPAMKSLEDLDLWLRVARRYHIYSMSELLTDYRLHGNTITAKSFAREEAFEQKLYEKVLAADPQFDRRTIFRNMTRRFALRHLSLGNYRQARDFLKQSLAYGFSLASSFLLLVTYVPSNWLESIKALRRRLRLAFLR
jgi:glycosyltransferase involved in cell wall biosynthesis